MLSQHRAKDRNPLDERPGTDDVAVPADTTAKAARTRKGASKKNS